MGKWGNGERMRNKCATTARGTENAHDSSERIRRALQNRGRNRAGSRCGEMRLVVNNRETCSVAPVKEKAIIGRYPKGRSSLRRPVNAERQKHSETWYKIP
jgi:hypothetical protein